jgi:putative endonuclease
MSLDRRGARQRLGQRGEALAARRLEAEGYRLLERNYRCPAGEVDLVAMDGECLVFVEVRTRRGDLWGTPEESVTRAKQLRLVQVAEHYLAEHEACDADWRIDVVAVDMDRRGRLRRVDIVRDAVSL